MNQGRCVGKSHVRQSGASNMSKSCVRLVHRKEIAEKFTCPICGDIFTQATSINLCLHTFCKDCIYQKLQEAEVKCCPECKEDLGPNPEQYLRFDEKLNNIANTIFPPGSSARGNAKSVTPQLNNTRPEVPKAIAPGTETVPQAIGASQGALNKVDDASHVAERTDHLSQTSSHESSNFPPPVPNKKQSSGKMPQAACIISEPKDRQDSSEVGTNLKVYSKRKGKKHGKAPQSASGKKKDKEKIDSSVEILSDGFEGFSDIGEKYDDTSSGKTLSDEPEKTPHPVWFHLAPHKDDNGKPFPALKSPNIHVKNGMTLTVTLIQKFVATKLNLKDESEVDIFCAGERLSPNLTMGDIIEIWVKTIPNQEPIYVDSQEPGKSLYLRDIMLKLEYGRSKKPGFPKQK